MTKELNLDVIEHRCIKCGECWEYRTSAKTEHHRRYPQIQHQGKVLLVRRVAYQLSRPNVSMGKRSVLPGCGNPYCINPEHQKLLTESQKCQLAAERGAFSNPARGKKIAEARRNLPGAKLKPEDASEIRNSSEAGPVLAERYGIDKSLVSAIRHGKRWKDYSNPFAGLMA